MIELAFRRTCASFSGQSVVLLFFFAQQPVLFQTCCRRIHLASLPSKKEGADYVSQDSILSYGNRTSSDQATEPFTKTQIDQAVAVAGAEGQCSRYSEGQIWEQELFYPSSFLL